MKKDILLVEDNPDDQELTLNAFARLGVADRVRVFDNGIEVVEYLLGPEANHAIQPILILLDLNLPKLNGIEVLQRLRADPRTQTIPIVMLTSSPRDEDRLKSYRTGINSYICKPIDFDQFLWVTKQLSLYWTTVNEPPTDKPSTDDETPKT
ncbi:MAG: response regulator [Candidatus Thiodiazotropha sp. (ex Dulcina madagascariensis)]|nr:response regulator [Candidatus Thiodiazotropha sp. (ex Epidulcina cf. delphinae)]MCU7923524.1 response regulator [Candidatus Thiodiazotropha sp. (ex Dulcina madagascariensis)]MCU7926119.1 response regulator [Candidatus Thiodiazotropha sp. (ex Dulcina madagascariensis)]